MSATQAIETQTEPAQAWLIAQAQQGDKAAFKQLYTLHYQRVYALCFRLAGQRDLAEEATQDTFVRLWQKLPLFDGKSQFTTWLHSLTVNQALSSINKQKSFWARLLPSEQLAEKPAPEMQPEIQYERLDKLLLQLPERARIVFVLFALEGYRHEEIAEQLNIAVGTSKAQYHRARQLLQEML